MPLQNVHFIEADIKEKKIMEEPRVVANDDIAFIVSITDNGNSIDTSLVTQTVLASVRPDRKTVITPGVLLEDGTVKFELGHTETQKSGQVKATAQLFDSEGDRISSVAFSFHVERDPTGEDYIPTEKDKTFIEIVLVEGPEVIQQAKDVTAAAQQATSNADTATGRADTAAAGAESVIDEFSGFKDSAAKAKSFGTVDARFEELEKDSFMPMKNRVLNSDAQNGTANWYATNSSIATRNNVFVNTATTSNAYAFQVLETPLIVGRKYYTSILIRVLSEAATHIRVEYASTLSHEHSVYSPVKDNWYKLSGVGIASTTAAHLRVRHFYPSEDAAFGKEMEFGKVVSIDLTEAFGAGNEPTKEEMDALLAFYPSSWFDGTVNLAENKKLVKFLLNQLRAKANKQQEGWIEPTLLNGWTSFDAARTFKYRKDEFGKVHFKGSIKGGTRSSTICVLPVGYRPAQTSHFIVNGNNTNFATVYTSGGNIVFAEGLTTHVGMDSISYYTD